ncbi:MAG: DNA N-6-adenine-methyltransferase [Verrucomicrobiota bacterium]
MNDLFVRAVREPEIKGKAFSHERVPDGKDEWLTPPEILAALGEFELDPCAPIIRPWPMARRHFTRLDDGLAQRWHGRVWCNPPYGAELPKWLGRLAAHGNGIALVFARTETRAFFDHVWPKADALLFIKGRLSFYNVDGTKSGSAGAPSVLIAYGADNAPCLESSGIAGHFLRNNG